MSFFSKLLKVISHKKYQKNPLGKKLSPLQQSVLNIGAVNAEQTMFYCDSLETGSEKEEIRNNLAAYYDIIDEESALHTLDNIDMDALLKKELMGLVPIQILCRDDCKGLCKVCGTNLNHGTCNCDDFVPDPRLSVFNDILKN